MQRDQIETIVLQVLRGLVPKNRAIRLDDRLYDELKLLSDDATDMALAVQRHSGIKVPLKIWESVYTVRDVIDVLERAANETRAS